MGDLVKKAVEMEAKAQLNETLLDSSTSNLLSIVLFSVAMLVGCYLSGIVPLTLTLSEKKIKYVSLSGAGLLVGTALTVIIPEGVHALYASQVKHKEEGPLAKDEHSDHDHERHSDIHMMIGLTLVLGFVFMLIIDHFSSHSSSEAKGKGSTATVGLVVHAAADGIALGAAANTAQNEVTMIVFVAIMLHKAPAAFGLVSFLLHEGVERPRIRRHLAAFAASAPLMALVTYGALSMHHTLLPEATGLSLLFSAGTFLYVATVHVLPEVQNRDEPSGRLELFCLVCSTLLPLLLSLTHHH